MSGWPSGVRGGVHVPFVVWPAADTITSISAAIEARTYFVMGNLPVFTCQGTVGFIRSQGRLNLARGFLAAADGELQAALKGQGHRAQFVRRIVHKRKVVVIGVSELLGVIADDHCAFAQAMRDQLQV